MITYYELTSPQAIAGLRDYLVLALRSTGPDPSVDRVFQLGMLRVQGSAVVNRNSTLIDPGRPIPPELSERCGITDADAARGLSYPQMAFSLAALLLEGVVVADEEALGFVAKMLEAEGYEGKFAFVDVRTLASSLWPEQGYLECEALCGALSLRPEEAPGILHDASLRFSVLQACQEKIGVPDRGAPEEPAAAPDAVQTPIRQQEPPKTEEKKKKGLFPLIPLKSRPAPRKRRQKKDLLGNVWEMSTEDFVSYGAAIASVIAALIFLPSWARWKLLLLGVALFVLACVVKPHTPGSGKAHTTDDGPPSFIILTWNETGEYGENWTAVNEDGAEESYIAFHLPSGIYRVLNNNTASAKVTVCDDVPEEKSVDIQDLALEESSRTVTVLASKSKEITLNEGQHLRLSEKAENVIFQYLSEIPEVAANEKDQTEDPNATAITAWVNADKVRLRKSASVSAFIMAEFNTGKEVLVTGTTGDWTAVTVDNQKGYIYSRYITYEKPAGAD